MGTAATFFGRGIDGQASITIQNRFLRRMAWSNIIYTLGPYIKHSSLFQTERIKAACKILYISSSLLALDHPSTNQVGITINQLLQAGAENIPAAIPIFIATLPEGIRERFAIKYSAFSKQIDAAEGTEQVLEIFNRFKGQNCRSLSKIPAEFVRGKTFVVRVDFNDIHAPFHDDIRLNAALDTLQYIIDREGKIVLLAHRGRPEGFSGELTNDPLLEAIGTVLPGLPLQKVNGFLHSAGPFSVTPPAAIENTIALIAQGQAVLIDNLRFDEAETTSDIMGRHAFCFMLSMLGDVYVLDGYPISHRNNTSVTQFPFYLPSVGGFWLEHEIAAHREFLAKILDPTRGTMACLFGGIKPDKLEHIKPLCSLLRAGDRVFIGGHLAKHARQDEYFGRSLSDKGIKVSFQAEEDDSQLDISQSTIEIVETIASGASIIFWNGAFGKIEDRRYQSGSFGIIRELFQRLNALDNPLQVLFVSGGETAPMVKEALGLTEQTRHSFPGLYISTGGGTSLRDLGTSVENLGFISLWGIPEELLVF